MKSWIKILLSLIALGALVIGLLLWRINPLLDSFRPKIAALISDKVGQPVTLGGLSLTYFPLAVTVSDVALQSGGKSAGGIQKLVLSSSLSPLLSGQLEVREIGIEGAQLHVERGADGSIKINGVPIGSGASKTSAPAPDESPATSDKKASVSISVENAWVKNSDITVHDASVTPPQDIVLKDLSAELHDVGTNGTPSFALSADVFGEGRTNLSISGSGRLEGLMPKGSMKLKWSDINFDTLAALAKAYGKGAEAPDLHDRGDLELTFQLDDKGMSASGSFNGTKARLAYKDLFSKNAGERFTITFKGGGTPLAPAMETFAVQLGKLEFDAPFSVALPTAPSGSPSISAGLKTSAFPLAEVGKFVPKARSYDLSGEVVADVKAAPAKAGHRLTGTVDLKNVGFEIPQTGSENGIPVSDINGHAELKDGGATLSPLSLSFAGQKIESDLKIASLDTMAIQLNARSADFKLGPVMKAATGTSNASIESSTLQNLKLTSSYSQSEKKASAVISVDGGTLAQLPLNKSQLTIDAKLAGDNGLQSAILQPSTIAVFGGSLAVQGSLSEQKQITAQVQGNGLDLEKLMDFASPGAKIGLTGTLNSLAVKLSGPQTKFSDQMSGSVAAEAGKGTIEGFNLLGQTFGKIGTIPLLGAAIGNFVPEKFRPLLQKDSTEFDRLSVVAQLNGKNINLTSVNLVHQAYELSGSGEIRADGELSLNAQLRLTPALATGMVEKEKNARYLMDKNGGIVFPVVITRKGGIFLVFPDVSNLGKRALQNTATDAAAKVLDKAVPGLGNALDSLFK